MFLDFWYLYFPCKKLILTEGGSGAIFVHWQLKFSFWHSSSFLQWWMGPVNDREKIGTTTKICLFGCRICIWRKRQAYARTWTCAAFFSRAFCLLDRVPNFFCLSYKYPNCGCRGRIRNSQWRGRGNEIPTVVATNRFAIDIYSNFHFLICKSCISVMQ